MCKMNCAYELPSLLQLSAEKVASEISTNESMYHYLKHIQLPELYISFIENHFFYSTVEFIAYIKEKAKNSKFISAVAPSEPKWRENGTFKLTVGNKRVLYMSTLNDLGLNMLKLDFPEGEYELCELHEGYALTTKNYKPAVVDTKHVFNSGSDKGFLCPLPEKFMQNDHHLRILNLISRYLSSHWWDIMAKHLTRIIHNENPSYCNFPIFFYLSEYINVEDLDAITLTCPSVITNCGNVETCWYVFHAEKGRIGIALKQVRLYEMMYDEVGVGLLISNGHHAIGNFDYNFHPKRASLEYEIEPDHHYQCEFDPCHCDYTPNNEVLLRN